ncbi:type II secretion system protein [Rhodomicrobium udaipurense]|uniref:Prepilin-type N-terminal cleavage/methylation domain-containing protein n=1 Tax=Rhodomicrobium udaipurense TaxID=1202716 RepID=A0A8I1KKJ2_9HYPH|nr:prepilin-type N-terminal cleavage/methylation domain-containing protein [Rhodomicrobium udaipurense]MBJ7544134.1 prepilin-type N-terminal cleavage/methylation domain-containing protein [Rhodomicrobium udaipurense]
MRTGDLKKGQQKRGSHRGGSPGFTLMEMLLVLAIIGVLASVVAPSVMGALTRAREAALQQDLKTMRKLIDDYYTDKGVFPPSLQTLVDQGYLRAMPPDPVNGNRTTWKGVSAQEGGVSDVRSLSTERGQNGVPYSEW